MPHHTGFFFWAPKVSDWFVICVKLSCDLVVVAADVVGAVVGQGLVVLDQGLTVAAVLADQEVDQDLQSDLTPDPVVNQCQEIDQSPGKDQGSALEIGQDQGIDPGKGQGIDPGKGQGIDLEKDQGIDLEKGQGIGHAVVQVVQLMVNGSNLVSHLLQWADQVIMNRALLMIKMMKGNK